MKPIDLVGTSALGPFRLFAKGRCALEHRAEQSLRVFLRAHSTPVRAELVEAPAGPEPVEGAELVFPIVLSLSKGAPAGPEPVEGAELVFPIVLSLSKGAPAGPEPAEGAELVFPIVLSLSKEALHRVGGHFDRLRMHGHFD